MHRAIAEAADHVLKDPSVEFLILGEEDLVVSSDALEYFTWARQEFARDERVLAVCSHSPGGQGWDERGAADDAGADQHRHPLRNRGRTDSGYDNLIKRVD